MLILVSGATSYKRTDTIGHLIVPRQWNDPKTLELTPGKWAMDNGAFHGFDEGGFMRMVERFYGIRGCLFVTAPDVVGDAAATLARFPFWCRLLHGLGFPVALVAQDGLLPDRIPWGELQALFIGGTDRYKESEEVRGLCGLAQARGVWVHWGRVNGFKRYALATKAGCDSIDGSGFSMYPDTTIPRVAEWEAKITTQPELRGW